MKKFFKLNINLTSLELKLVIIGFLGLTPFIFGLIDLIINKSNYFFLINIPKVYGVIIFTFLGGIYWGIILNPASSIFQSKNLLNYTILWSITPSILGLIIFTIDTSYSLIFLSFGFGLCQTIDEIFYKRSFFSYNYIVMRRILSFFVISILIFSYFLMHTSNIKTM